MLSRNINIIVRVDGVEEELRRGLFGIAFKERGKPFRSVWTHEENNASSKK